MGAKRNAVTGLITQLIIIALGLIVPRIMITNYGSDTNGLTNTLTQIFSYIALLESGIGQSTRNALYKPISIVPTVHEGVAVQQMEKRGIQTNIGNLNGASL